MNITITLIIIVITSIVSIIAFYNKNIFKLLMFNAYDIKHFKKYYRFISYSLVHANWGHLLINMFVLFSFGRIVEIYFKINFSNVWILYFIFLYLGSLLISTLPAYIKNKDNYSYNAVGASGAVAAIIFSMIVFDPLGKIFIFPFPFGIPSILFGVLYLGYSWYMNKQNKDNIGHDAHFWGAVFGFVFTILLKPSLFLEMVEKIF